MKFENVLPRLNMKEFGKMTDEELTQVITDLRAIRTDIPETGQRRRKTRSKDFVAKQLVQLAEQMNMPIEELLKNPEIAGIIASKDDEE